MGNPKMLQEIAIRHKSSVYLPSSGTYTTNQDNKNENLKHIAYYNYYLNQIGYNLSQRVITTLSVFFRS